LAKSSAHTAAAKATSATEAHTRAAAGVAILADLNHAALPVIAVELLDCGAGIIRALKDDDTRSFGATIRADMDIGSNNSAISSWNEC
jgi:hypothetical protein